MGRKKWNLNDYFVFAEMMIFVLAIPGNRIVISTTPESDGW